MADATGTVPGGPAALRPGRRTRPLCLGLLALGGIAALNQASLRGLPHQVAALGGIPLTVLWFQALEDYSNPAHGNRIVSAAHALACAGFVGWLLGAAAS